MKDGRLIEIEWEGRPRYRRDVIRELHAAGMPVAEIARRLDVAYQIAYMTLRGSVAHPSAPSSSSPGGSPRPADAVLLGCVSQKHGRPMAAKDLYRSELFRRRRLYAEASGVPWWIVSAEYGLVDPDQKIAPYDTRIARLQPSDRQRLAESVASDLEREIGPLTGKRLEVHAGEEYVQAVGPALRRRGAQLTRPLLGLRIGEQLAWYGKRLGLAPRASYPPSHPHVSSTRNLIGDGRGISQRITEMFMRKQLDLSARPKSPSIGWEGMPEVRAASALRGSGASAADVRLFLTFNAAMDRARDADTLANAAVAMWRAEPWTVQPLDITRRPLTDLADTLRRFGVSQRHMADAFAWRVIAETLADPSAAPATRGAIHDGAADARVLLEEVTSRSGAATQRFPLLGGPKISALWIRLLAHPGGAQITSLEIVPVAVDVQVRKVTEYLGVTDTGGLPLEDVRAAIQETWARDVAEHGAAGPDGIDGTPGALDPALWFYAKWGCTYCEHVKGRMQVSPLCDECRFPSKK